MPLTLSPVGSSRIVPVPAAEVFELLARPERHAELDGSGSVQGTQPGTPARLSQGAKFGMHMRIGLPYKILNEVVEFEEGRRIAWRHFGGHVWRYELEDLGAGRSKVTETFDPKHSRSPLVLRLMRARSRNAKSIEATLDRIEAWAKARAGA